MNKRSQQRRATNLVRSHASDVLAFLERRVRSADAADVLADTLLTVWRRCAAVPADEVEARMWFFGVARNTLANAERAGIRRSKLADKLRGQLQAEPQELAHTETVEIREALNKLPTNLRDLVMLIHWDGFSISEAAQVLGIPASTARSQYQSARTKLASALSITAK